MPPIQPEDQRRRYQCPIVNCPEIFGSRNSLRNHLKTHNPDECFPCGWQECDFVSSSFSGLQRHVDAAHLKIAGRPAVAAAAAAAAAATEEVQQPQGYACTRCEQRNPAAAITFARFEDLQTHTAAVHEPLNNHHEQNLMFNRNNGTSNVDYDYDQEDYNDVDDNEDFMNTNNELDQQSTSNNHRKRQRTGDYHHQDNGAMFTTPTTSSSTGLSSSTGTGGAGSGGASASASGINMKICPYKDCGMRYKSAALWYHIQIAHKKIRFACLAPGCGKISNLKGDLKKHFHSLHPALSWEVMGCNRFADGEEDELDSSLVTSSTAPGMGLGPGTSTGGNAFNHQQQQQQPQFALNSNLQRNLHALANHQMLQNLQQSLQQSLQSQLQSNQSNDQSGSTNLQSYAAAPQVGDYEMFEEEEEMLTNFSSSEDEDQDQDQDDGETSDLDEFDPLNTNTNALATNLQRITTQIQNQNGASAQAVIRRQQDQQQQLPLQNQNHQQQRRLKDQQTAAQNHQQQKVLQKDQQADKSAANPINPKNKNVNNNSTTNSISTNNNTPQSNNNNTLPPAQQSNGQKSSTPSSRKNSEARDQQNLQSNQSSTHSTSALSLPQHRELQKHLAALTKSILTQPRVEEAVLAVQKQSPANNLQHSPSFPAAPPTTEELLPAPPKRESLQSPTNQSNNKLKQSLSNSSTKKPSLQSSASSSGQQKSSASGLHSPPAPKTSRIKSPISPPAPAHTAATAHAQESDTPPGHSASSVAVGLGLPIGPDMEFCPYEGCDLQYKKSALYYHIQIVHKKIRFICIAENCFKRCTLKCDLKKHFIKQHPEQNWDDIGCLQIVEGEEDPLRDPSAPAPEMPLDSSIKDEPEAAAVAAGPQPSPPKKRKKVKKGLKISSIKRRQDQSKKVKIEDQDQGDEDDEGENFEEFDQLQHNSYHNGQDLKLDESDEPPIHVNAADYLDGDEDLDLDELPATDESDCDDGPFYMPPLKIPDPQTKPKGQQDIKPALVPIRLKPYAATVGSSGNVLASIPVRQKRNASTDEAPGPGVTPVVTATSTSRRKSSTSTPAAAAAIHKPLREDPSMIRVSPAANGSSGGAGRGGGSTATDIADLIPCPWAGCTNRYRHQRSVELHIESAHEGIRYSCHFEDCGATYTRKTYLNSHIIQHHSGQISPRRRSSQNSKVQQQDQQPTAAAKRSSLPSSTTNHHSNNNNGSPRVQPLKLKRPAGQDQQHQQQMSSRSESSRNSSSGASTSSSHSPSRKPSWQLNSSAAALAPEIDPYGDGAEANGGDDGNSFACCYPGCERVYRIPESLRAHVRDVHEGQRSSCPVPGCGRSYTRGYECRNHILKAHPTWQQ